MTILTADKTARVTLLVASCLNNVALRMLRGISMTIRETIVIYCSVFAFLKRYAVIFFFNSWISIIIITTAPSNMYIPCSICLTWCSSVGMLSPKSIPTYTHTGTEINDAIPSMVKKI